MQNPSYVYLNSADANATLLNDETAVAGTTFYYQARAYNMAGNSSFTSAASATIPSSSPTAPNNVAGGWRATEEAVHLTWTDRSNNEEYFIVERKTEEETEWIQIVQLDQNKTQYDDGDVTGDTFYYYRIKAANPIGNAYSGTKMVYVPAH